MAELLNDHETKKILGSVIEEGDEKSVGAPTPMCRSWDDDVGEHYFNLFLHRPLISPDNPLCPSFAASP